MFNQIKGLLQFLPPFQWWVSLQLYHELLLFARNGYGRGTADFIPFSISNKPKVLDDDMDFNISYDVIFSIQDFIQANLYALKSLADGRISQEIFVQSII